jgi:hypothetical protein
MFVLNHALFKEPSEGHSQGGIRLENEVVELLFWPSSKRRHMELFLALERELGKVMVRDATAL